MRRNDSAAFVVAVLIGFGPCAGASTDPMQVVAVRPVAQALRAGVTNPIFVLFDRPVDRATVGPDSLWAFGRWSGTATGQYQFLANDRLVVLRPDQSFSYGERVMVVLSHDVRGADGAALREAGVSWQFWTRALPSQSPFAIADVLSTRTLPAETTRAYGGVATDLDNDGWLDLTIVNEDTGDLRVFMNRADGTGLFDDFLEPTTPVNFQASPNEPSDFDRDGNADIAVANTSSDSVSIVLGNGDGTFAPQQEVPVGGDVRGIAVLDVDGDGDTDIVNTNFSGPAAFSLLVNDGTGMFAAPVFFGPPGSGEWALAAADMNGDRIMDLVSAEQQGSGIVSVYAGNGDGTFSLVSTRAAGGAIWMLTTGDVDGDGNEDVAAVGSANDTGVILLGDGAGGLGAPSTVATDPFPLATDLGDIDGDGDLDWITSSFAGNWFLFGNDGSGGFSFRRQFAAPNAASCALMLDADNDGDLDLALVDELADVVILQMR